MTLEEGKQVVDDYKSTIVKTRRWGQDKVKSVMRGLVRCARPFSMRSNDRKNRKLRDLVMDAGDGGGNYEEVLSSEVEAIVKDENTIADLQQCTEKVFVPEEVGMLSIIICSHRVSCFNLF